MSPGMRRIECMGVADVLYTSCLCTELRENLPSCIDSTTLERIDGQG